MKKTIVITSLITSFVSLSAFGQGYFQFTTGKSQVWDAFSTFPPATTSNVDVAFLWGQSGDVPLVDNIIPSTPTSDTAYIYTPAAWADIINDPNFQFAVDATSANAGNIAVTRSTAKGALAYNGGADFGVNGTTIGTTYTVFMVGWDADYATPLLAAEADAAVGWSAPFNYRAVASTAIPNSMAGVTPPFGVGDIPEPTSIALAGLGGLSLLLFRRRIVQ